MAACFCCHAARVSREKHRKGETLFWGLFTCFLLLLGINKQLDLQTWFTLFGRHLAEEEGWYPQRRKYQAVFIALIALSGITTLIFLWQLARRTMHSYRLALCGGVFLGSFILIRAASFHYVDRMLGLQFNHLTLNCLLELGGILCVGCAALKSWPWRRRVSPPPCEATAD